MCSDVSQKSCLKAKSSFEGFLLQSLLECSNARFLDAGVSYLRFCTT